MFTASWFASSYSHPVKARPALTVKRDEPTWWAVEQGLRQNIGSSTNLQRVASFARRNFFAPAKYFSYQWWISGGWNIFFAFGGDAEPRSARQPLIGLVGNPALPNCLELPADNENPFPIKKRDNINDHERKLLKSQHALCKLDFFHDRKMISKINPWRENCQFIVHLFYIGQNTVTFPARVKISQPRRKNERGVFSRIRRKRFSA